MNSLIRDELILILNVFGDIKEKEQIKIISVCSKMLDSADYVGKLNAKLDELVSTPDFDITTDFINMVSSILDVNKDVEFYKELSVERMKICIYCMLYSYLLKSDKNNSLNKIEIHKFRILYFNTTKVLMLKPKVMKIKKEGLISAIGRCIGIECLVGDNVLI